MGCNYSPLSLLHVANKSKTDTVRELKSRKSITSSFCLVLSQACAEGSRRCVCSALPGIELHPTGKYGTSHCPIVGAENTVILSQTEFGRRLICPNIESPKHGYNLCSTVNSSHSSVLAMRSTTKPRVQYLGSMGVSCQQNAFHGGVPMKDGIMNEECEQAMKMLLRSAERMTSYSDDVTSICIE